MFSQLCWIFCTNADLCQRAALGWSVQNEKNYPLGRIIGFICIISCNRGKFVQKKKKELNSPTMDDEYSQQISWLLVSLTRRCQTGWTCPTKLFTLSCLDEHFIIIHHFQQRIALCIVILVPGVIYCKKDFYLVTTGHDTKRRESWIKEASVD